VADELVDIAFLSAEMTLSEKLMEHVMPPLSRQIFMRVIHPALDSWGKEARTS